MLGPTPLTSPEQLETGAVQNEVHGAAAGPDARLPPGKGLAAAGQGGVIRHVQFQPEQRQHAAGEHFGLTQGQVEYRAQGQHQFDCEIRLAVLTTGRGAPACCPARQRVLVQPQREVAAPAQASFVGRAVS